MAKLRKRTPRAIVESFAKDYGEVHYEMQTYRSVVKYMSDIDLIDSLLPYTTDHGYEMEGVIDCYVKLSRGDDDLTPAERIQMESYYLLLNTDLGFDA